ncbi:MAG TPA: AMP-binding protein, partial [Pirellula sp.]|nr:AMP-binding protein [Pirellula sp.]
MNDKPFYVDNSIGLRKTYADLLSDVSLIQKIPSVFGSDNYYQLFTLMIAAIYSDAELALSQDPLYDTEMSGMGAQTTAVSRIRVTELANTIVRSECKIGVFTSGTTGRPRLIQHRTETLIRSVRANDHHRDDVWGLTYHPASFAGLQVFFQAVFNINPLINLTGLNARTVNKTIQNQNITHISATPTWMRLACSDEAVHQQVRHITTGGEIADCALIEQIERKF